MVFFFNAVQSDSNFKVCEILKGGHSKESYSAVHSCSVVYIATKNGSNF